MQRPISGGVWQGTISGSIIDLQVSAMSDERNNPPDTSRMPPGEATISDPLGSVTYKTGSGTGLLASGPNIEIQELLVRPREALDIEIKGWLNLADAAHRCDLAKAIIAIANHGGGYILIGYSEDNSGQFTPDSKDRPAHLASFAQDAVQDLVQKYLDPPVQCRVEHVEHPQNLGRFPIVIVPGGHRIPIKAKSGSPDGKKLVQNRVYVRRPGPRSEEPQSAAEWDELLERALRARSSELVDVIRNVISGASATADVPRGTADRLKDYIQEASKRWETRVSSLPQGVPPRFPHGYYEAGFALDGQFEIASLPTFRDILQRALKNHSGWPPFVYITNDIYRPAPINGSIEAWMGPREDGSFDVPAHHDFWRASPEGFFYTRRGYNEDGSYRGIEPGTTLDITTPTWRIGEILLEIFYVASAMGAEHAGVLARFKWTGLGGRRLVSVGNPKRTAFPSDRYRAQQHDFTIEKAIPVAAIYDGLPEIVFEILSPLYSLFDFWQLPKRLVEEELREMRRNTFA